MNLEYHPVTKTIKTLIHILGKRPYPALTEESLAGVSLDRVCTTWDALRYSLCNKSLRVTATARQPLQNTEAFLSRARGAEYSGGRNQHMVRNALMSFEEVKCTSLKTTA